MRVTVWGQIKSRGSEHQPYAKFILLCTMSLPMIQDSWIYVGIDLLFFNSVGQHVGM